MTNYQELSLFAEFAIVVITLVYAVFAGGQWREIRRQADIANKTLLLTQRPKLRVRNVFLTPTPTTDSQFQLREQPVDVEFSVINIGNAEAKIIKSHCCVFWTSDPLPIRLPYKESSPNNPTEQRSTSPGEAIIASCRGENLTEERPEGVWRKHYTTLYVMGYVDYVDALNLTRRTAFCRRLARTPEGSRYFVAEENPDYEYED